MYLHCLIVWLMSGWVAIFSNCLDFGWKAWCSLFPFSHCFLYYFSSYRELSYFSHCMCILPILHMLLIIASLKSKKNSVFSRNCTIFILNLILAKVSTWVFILYSVRLNKNEIYTKWKQKFKKQHWQHLMC